MAGLQGVPVTAAQLKRYFAAQSTPTAAKEHLSSLLPTAETVQPRLAEAAALDAARVTQALSIAAAGQSAF